jgi:hypothetical protein
MRLIPTVVLSFVVLSTASVASAEGSQWPIATTIDEGSGYGYEFSDDSLLGGANTAYSTTIIGSRRVLRTLLLRPRTQFVTEMLKSVEAL